MARQRWGTFSVAAHKLPNPFVTDVLLYDRLVIPVPSDLKERHRWRRKGRAPGRLDACLNILGPRAIQIPWDQERRNAFRKQYAAAAALNRGYWVDAKGITRQVLIGEVQSELAGGETRPPWVMAAYPCASRFEREFGEAALKRRREKLALAFSHRFLVPKGPPKAEMKLLKQVVKLSSRTDFAANRTRFYQWQEDIVEKENLSEMQALSEMEKLLKEHEAMVRDASKKVYLKFACTVLTAGITLAGGPITPLAAAGALLCLTQFALFDRKATLESAESSAAAMFHDVRKHLGWQ